MGIYAKEVGRTGIGLNIIKGKFEGKFKHVCLLGYMLHPRNTLQECILGM